MHASGAHFPRLYRIIRIESSGSCKSRKQFMVWLILIFSLFNVALAYHATVAFRRDRAARLERLAIEQWREAKDYEALLAAKAAALEAVERGLPPLDDAPAESPPADDDPAESDAAESDPPEQPEAAASTGPEERQPKPPPLSIEPTIQPAIEELYYRSAELIQGLAEIDHSVLRCQAGEAPTEEKLIEMWPAVAERIEPVTRLIARIAKESPELKAPAESIIAECSKLSERVESTAAEDDGSNSRMHQLRDLLVSACAFRDQCEDALAKHRGVDHRHTGGQGQVAFEKTRAWLSGVETEHCAIGFELDHLRELNSMYGALAISAVLDGLPGCIEPHLPGTTPLYRRHSQHFLALVPADIATATAAADEVRQRIANTKFHFQDSTIETTISAAVVPLALGDGTLPRIMTALKKAKTEGYDRVVCDHGNKLEVISARTDDIETAEVKLKA